MFNTIYNYVNKFQKIKNNIFNWLKVMEKKSSVWLEIIDWQILSKYFVQNTLCVKNSDHGVLMSRLITRWAYHVRMSFVVVQNPAPVILEHNAQVTVCLWLGVMQSHPTPFFLPWHFHFPSPYSVCHQLII